MLNHPSIPVIVQLCLLTFSLGLLSIIRLLGIRLLTRLHKEGQVGGTMEIGLGLESVSFILNRIRYQFNTIPLFFFKLEFGKQLHKTEQLLLDLAAALGMLLFATGMLLLAKVFLGAESSVSEMILGAVRGGAQAWQTGISEISYPSSTDRGLIGFLLTLVSMGLVIAICQVLFMARTALGAATFPFLVLALTLLRPGGMKGSVILGATLLVCRLFIKEKDDAMLSGMFVALLILVFFHIVPLYVGASNSIHISLFNP